MSNLRVLELFAGIGACSKALENLGIPHEIVDAVEIDKYAVKSFNAVHGTNFEPQDITKWDKDIEVDLIMHGSPCFVAGTKVITDKGYKNIEDIQIGDKVLTHTNSFKTVEALGSDGIKDIYRVETQGTLPTYCTNNHPFYVRHKVKQWNNDKRAYEYKFTEPEKVRLFNLTKKNNYIGVPIIPDKENEFYNLDDETLWLLGRYVADGCHYNKPRKDRPSNTKYTNISVGNNKKLDFENHIKSYKYNNVDERNGCTNYRFGVDFTNIVIKSNVGLGAINKKIPMEILQLPKQKLQIFLDGYMSGDGCNIRNTNIYQATTISRELAESLLLAIQKVYNIGCRIYHTKRPKKYTIGDRVVNQNDTYMVRFDLKPKRPLYKVENNCIWYPIKKITNAHTQQTIYNITVEDDHTYTANNCYVGNCQDFSTAGKQAGGDEGSGTRSSLMYETIRIVEKLKPKYVIWENVKNLLSKKHIHNFNSYLNKMEQLGYVNYYQVLNAKDYGIPQNRERVFTVSILGNEEYKFPPKQKLEIRLKDILEDEVDEKYYLSDKQLNGMIKTKFNQYNVKNLLKDDGSCASCIKARFEGNPQLVSTGPSESTRKVCNEAIRRGLVSPNDVIEYSYSNARLSEIEDGHIRTQNSKDNQCMSTLKTNPQKLGVCVCVASRGRNPNNPSSRVAGLPTKQHLEPRMDGNTNTITSVQKDNYVAIRTANKQGYDLAEDGDGIDLAYPKSKTRRGRVGHGVSKTLACSDTMGALDGYRIRKLTPKECWRLMGFGDEDFEKARKVNSNTQLYKQAGNSICVPVLENILKNLLKEGIEEVDE